MPLLFKDISFEDRSDPFHGCPTDDVTITPVRVEHPLMIDKSKIDVYTIKIEAQCYIGLCYLLICCTECG